MPAFVWKGKNRDGKVVSGERVADNKEAVMALLRRDQILVSSVKEKGKEVALPKIGGGVPSKDLAIFTRQFSVMIDAGLPLVQCLEILGGQQENKTFARILQQTRMDVEGGASLADAVRSAQTSEVPVYTLGIGAPGKNETVSTILVLDISGSMLSPANDRDRIPKIEAMKEAAEERQEALAVVSPGAGEGRSWITANLAVLFAQMGKRTVLVDADLRRPRQHRIFGMSARAGLSTVLAGRAGWEAVADRVESWVRTLTPRETQPAA